MTEIARRTFLKAGASLLALTVGKSPARAAVRSTKGGGAGLTLARVITNIGSAALPATAFWLIGHPFKKGEVPSGYVVTAAIGGRSVPVQGWGTVTHADGSLAWAMLPLDLSGLSLSPGAAATLSLAASPGWWPTGTSRTNADWAALGDAVQITNLSTSGMSAPDMDGAGTWTASFDGSGANIVATLGSGSLGLLIKVKAPFVNGATVHRFLKAVMYYWVTQKADGTLGPIASKGPFIDNTEIYSPTGSITNAAQFTYDLVWLRGGIVQRGIDGLGNGAAYQQVPHVAMTFMTACRPDGQWDWAPQSADPKIWVSQDYRQTRKTLKIPPFSDILYNNYSPISGPYPLIGGNVAVSSISAGTFTVPSISYLFGVDAIGGRPVAVTFSGALPSGLLVSPNVYWARPATSTTFTLYDNITNALAGGSTGQIVPSNQLSGAIVDLAVVPTTSGPLVQATEQSGGRPDISLLTEWGSAYHVGNTEAYQKQARATAYAMAGIPVYVTNSATHTIISCLNAGSSPTTGTSFIGGGTGLGTSDTGAYWWLAGPSFSSNVNGGSTPTVATVNNTWNGWRNSDSSLDSSHWPSPLYAVWLMEGDPFLRDLLVYNGSRVIGEQAYLPLRNFTLDGVTYYYPGGILLHTGENTRVAAWAWRDLAYAAFACPDGSPEQAYYRTVMANCASAASAYIAYEGANYNNLGILAYVQNDCPPNTNPIASMGSPIGTFMQHYMALAAGFASLLVGDQVSGAMTIADFCAKFIVGILTAPGVCGYFATNYRFSFMTDDGGAAGRGNFVGSFAELGQCAADPQMHITYSNTSLDISYTADGSIGWTPAVGDKFRPQNYANDSSSNVPPAPSPFVDGTDYWIVNVGASSTPSSGTFRLSTTQGGPAIQASTLVSGACGWFIPSGQSCPLSGDISNGNTPDGYLQYLLAACSVQALRGATGAASAYSQALSRYGSTTNFNQLAMWAFQDTV